MSTLSLRLPESIHKGAREYAEKEGISVNQFAATAVAEKLAALGAADYVQSRAKRANVKKFRAALAAVPNVRPVEGDE
jgi:HicB family